MHEVPLPSFAVRGRKVLDVGCAAGETLANSFYAQAAERHGVDIDPKAIARGQEIWKELRLSVGSAESLPYPDAFFDVVITNVTLIYTDLPRSLAEAFRVLAPGGDLFLTTHDWKHWLRQFAGALRSRAPKRSVDHLYILGASICFICAGVVPKRPWKQGRETFQTRRSLAKALLRAGFRGMSFKRTARDFIVEAHKPPTAGLAPPAGDLFNR